MDVTEEFKLEELTNEPNQIELFLQGCSEALRREVKPIVLFGAGIIGKFYLQFLKKLNYKLDVLFCDNDAFKIGTFIEGIRIISFEELKSDFSDSYIIITSFEYYDDIFAQLHENNLSILLDPKDHNVILDTETTMELFRDYPSLVAERVEEFRLAYSMLNDKLSKQIFIDRLNYSITASSKFLTPLISNTPQYFDPALIKLSEEEIFIDGGGYTGDTIEEFIRQSNGKFNKIYSFEPELTKHIEFEKEYGLINNIRLVPYGLWSTETTLRFHANNDITSFLSNNGSVEIPVTTIDEFLKGEAVTFIKMDIEGAEIEALKGAQESIRKFKPKLAICVYHKAMDMVEIPIFLKKLVPDYKFYFRHYSINICETVCYAIPE